MIITFTQDVTLDEEDPGTGPHYLKGYECDASESFAQRMISRGVAVLGSITVSAEQPISSESHQPATEALAPDSESKSSKRKSARWHPLDE